MQDKYNFEIDGTVIWMRRIEYVEKGFDKGVRAACGWSRDLTPLRYQASHLTDEGWERLIGTATQYAPNTNWYIQGSHIAEYLGVSRVGDELKEAAPIFKQDADSFIASIEMTVSVYREDDE